VKLAPDKVAADLERALRVRAERDGRSELVYYPIYFSVGPAEVDRQDVVTAKLNKLTFATPGHFEPVEDALTDFSVLAATTPGAAEYDSAQARPGVSPRACSRSTRNGSARSLWFGGNPRAISTSSWWPIRIFCRIASGCG